MSYVVISVDQSLIYFKKNQKLVYVKRYYLLIIKTLRKGRITINLINIRDDDQPIMEFVTWLSRKHFLLMFTMRIVSKVTQPLISEWGLEKLLAEQTDICLSSLYSASYWKKSFPSIVSPFT